MLSPEGDPDSTASSQGSGIIKEDGAERLIVKAKCNGKLQQNVFLDTTGKLPI